MQRIKQSVLSAALKAGVITSPVTTEEIDATISGDEYYVDLLAEIENRLKNSSVATRAISRAVAVNAELQTGLVSGSRGWHLSETVDDRLHDALAALGE